MIIKQYVFTDYDDYDIDVQYDIAERKYAILIEHCFKFSSFFSLDFFNSYVNIEERLKPYVFWPEITESIKNSWYEKYAIIDYLNSDVLPNEQIKRITELYSSVRIPKDNKCRKFFNCTPESQISLTEMFNSVFAYFWKDTKMPQNLIFYREDFSVLFYAHTHEGECFLYPRSNENVSEILQLAPWKTI